MKANNIALEQTLGDFIHKLPPSQEYLILSFSPSSIPLNQRWRTTCLSADYLADYLSTFLQENQRLSRDKCSEIKSAVSYIANELLENGLKYCIATSTLPISIQVHLHPSTIIFQLTNSITRERSQKFQSLIQQLLQGNPSEMYLAQVEKNAFEENNTESNLGLLTMLNDYYAKLGWKFELFPEQASEMVVKTMVQLKI